jgi:predicted N-formylglutamate amidohydrolase
MSEAWRQIGEPRTGGILLIGDHASNHVPDDIDLGIDPALLDQHIAWDIGVAAVAEQLVTTHAIDAAILGGVSRLVVDCNRDEHAPGIIPIASDGHAIPGNALSHDAHRARLERFYFPYHAHLAATLAAARPAMILSLHSFTPALASHPEPRPWHIGILYNEDDRLARIAIPAFEARRLIVGDQLPYSGKLLNYTMNIHAEANAIPYLGIEMRQDCVVDAAGQQAMTAHIAHVLRLCTAHLA